MADVSAGARGVAEVLADLPSLAALRPDIWFKPTEVWEIRGAE